MKSKKFTHRDRYFLNGRRQRRCLRSQDPVIRLAAMIATGRIAAV